MANAFGWSEYGLSKPMVELRPRSIPGRRHVNSAKPLSEGDSHMFNRLDIAPPDPILGLEEAFKRDPNPAKINLSVGVYKDADGNTPVFQTVKHAEETILQSEASKSYLGIDGSPDYAAAVQSLIFGPTHPLVGGWAGGDGAHAWWHRRAARGRRLRQEDQPGRLRLGQPAHLAQPSERLPGRRTEGRDLSVFRCSQQPAGL